MRGDIRIRIPRFIAKAWNRFVDWGNVPIWSVGPWEFVRLDVLIATAFVVSTTYYTYASGVLGGLFGALVFIMVTMIALWFF